MSTCAEKYAAGMYPTVKKNTNLSHTHTQNEVFSHKKKLRIPEFVAIWMKLENKIKKPGTEKYMFSHVWKLERVHLCKQTQKVTRGKDGKNRKMFDKQYQNSDTIVS